MITEIYEDFTSVWCLFHHVSREKALRQINGGGCGVAAYATAEVLKARGFDVKHYSNCWHVWNRIDGVDYDTYRPEGYDVPVYLAWGAPMDGEVPDVDVYMWNNVLEALLVKAFLKRHNVPVPDLVHELIARKPQIARRTLKGWKMVRSQRVLNNLHHRYIKTRRHGPLPLPFEPLHLEIKKIETRD